MDGNPTLRRGHGSDPNHPRSSSHRPRVSVHSYHEPYVPQNIVRGQERARQREDRGADPTLYVLQEVLSHMQQQQNQATKNHRADPPDFLKSVLMMQSLKTNSYKGEVDTFKADAWLQNLEKNFAAIRCIEEYKKDISVYYLE
ncbi:unnamed protein product [Arabis nemorensis]|uniref:Retrotransposon gag domain-containing protein n=1 Tax=Arabis nemorensis TaxID=586526 RepID=A0A565BUL4_9BRAS|nr:unnamed protein product [Arabis nemorensis]